MKLSEQNKFDICFAKTASLLGFVSARAVVKLQTTWRDSLLKGSLTGDFLTEPEF